MASPLAHAIVAVTIGRIQRSSGWPLRVWLLGIVCAEAPDLDTVGFWLGVPYEHLFGHRGVTHSILFAVLFSWAVATYVSTIEKTQDQRTLWGYCFLATLSHGVLDALTDGGLGVAFFSPFDQTRYFFPIHPITVTPLEPSHVLGRAGVAVLASEAIWVWLPCALVLCGQWWMSRRRTAAAD